MKELYELKEKLCDELKAYAKKDMSSGSLDVIDKLAHSVKNIHKIIESYEEMEDYSNAFYPDYYSMRGRSNASGRSRAGRDSRGRYSSRGNSYNNSYGNSYEQYSYNGEDVMELREMMEKAPNEAIRQDLQRLIQKMENR